MRRSIRSLTLGVAVVSYLCLGAELAQAQQLRIENAYPRQLPLGQTTLVNVVIATRDDIQSAEISPSQGVSVSSVTRGETFQGALTWFSIAIEVTGDAKPGERARWCNCRRGALSLPL